MKFHTHATETGLHPVVLVLTMPAKERDQEEVRAGEMANLLKTTGRIVVARVIQHFNKPVGGTFIGSGKITELKGVMEEHGAKEAAFAVRLTPRQQRNLEDELDADVIDYDELILDIFEQGARSHQARLAVELARLEYLKARLRRLWTHLDRQRSGGSGGGVSGFMTGTGEKQIESDRRLIRERIMLLRGRLEEIESRTDRTLDARTDAFNIALVGYTNAGKSTLMNALTKAGVLAEDRLFATLDTRTARLPLPGRRGITLSDTVGFIRNLPPELIASFHATLAEVREADLLLHVVDCSSAVMDQQMESVTAVLKKIDADRIPVLVVFNQVDRCPSRTVLRAVRKRFPKSVAVSAVTGEGLDELRQRLAEAADAHRRKVTVRFPAGDGATSAWLRARATIVAERYEDETAILTIRCEPGVADQLPALAGVTVEG